MAAWVMRCAGLLALLAVTGNALAAHRHKEHWYQERWCDEHGGQMEVVMQDGTRVDCLIEHPGLTMSWSGTALGCLAVEFDFPDKWAESGFQGLNYGMERSCRPGMVLIIEDPVRFYLFRRSIERDQVARVRRILTYYNLDAYLGVTK